MNVPEPEFVYPPKLQPALRSPLARARREVGWLLIRLRQLGASEGATAVVRGGWRWVSRMSLRTAGMRRLTWMLNASRTSGPSHLLVAFIDVDGLSRIDEAFGRPAAARAVKAVGIEVRRRIGARALMFRYGGDEYVCATDAMSVEQLIGLLSDARSALVARGARTFSAGIAEVRVADTAYTIVKRAELHMFGAKQTPGVAVTNTRLPRDVDPA